MKKEQKGEQHPSSTKSAQKHLGPNEFTSRTDLTDSGQGNAGIQGQYPGTNDQNTQANPGGTAPERENPDVMNQMGSMQVALGSRERDKFGKVDKRSKKSGR